MIMNTPLYIYKCTKCGHTQRHHVKDNPRYKCEKCDKLLEYIKKDNKTLLLS